MSLVPRQNIRRIGVGFEDPGENDVYSDGSVCKGQQTIIEGLRSAPIYESIVSSRRKIKAEPSAGEIRKKELAGVWMEPVLNEIEKDNRKARAVMEEKRAFGLAKQAAAGLANIGVRYEMTAIANYVKLAYKYRVVRSEAIKSGSALAPYMAQRFSAQKIQEMEHSNDVLEAVLRYDCYHLAELLGCVVKRPTTYGVSNEEEKNT